MTNPTRTRTAARFRARLTVGVTTAAVTVAAFAGGAGSAGAQPGETTTTLPQADQDLGRIVPRPNSGHDPIDAGDRGGWQQVALFVALCLVVVAIGVWVWWRSRDARRRRRAAGRDPVSMARSHGGDVRKPRPPGIVD